MAHIYWRTSVTATQLALHKEKKPPLLENKHQSPVFFLFFLQAKINSFYLPLFLKQVKVSDEMFTCYLPLSSICLDETSLAKQLA